MRVLYLSAAMFVLGGCYSPQAVTPDRALSLWRSAEAGHAHQSPAAEATTTKPMTAEDVVQRVLLIHPELAAARSRVGAARAGADAVSVLDAAEVRVTEFHLDEVIDNETSFDVGLRLRPSRPGEKASQRDRAAQDVAVEEARRDALRVRLAARARAFHAAALLAQRREAVAREEVRIRDGAFHWTQERAKGEVATELDLSLAHLAALESADEVHAAQLDAEEAKSRLHALLGLPPTQTLELTGPPGGIDVLADTVPSREEALTQALEGRPELREAAARLRQAHADVWREEMRRWPWLSFAQASREFGPKSDPLSWGFALGVDLPIDRWLGDRVAERSARVEMRRQEELAAVSRVARQVDEALTGVTKASARFREIRSRLLPAISAAQAAADRARSLAAPSPGLRLRLEISRLRAHRRALATEEELIEAQIRLRSVLGRD